MFILIKYPFCGCQDLSVYHLRLSSVLLPLTPGAIGVIKDNFRICNKECELSMHLVGCVRMMFTWFTTTSMYSYCCSYPCCLVLIMIQEDVIHNAGFCKYMLNGIDEIWK